MKLNEKEALRYLGIRGGAADEASAALVKTLGEAFLTLLTPKHIYKKYDMTADEAAVRIGDWRIESRDLARCLAGCDAVYLFAATLGLAADREIQRQTALGAAEGAAAHAVCNALIEDYCDEIQAALAEQELASGRFLRPRFSPGYGDLRLETQRAFFRLLSPEKAIGVTLTDSLLMAPMKSVTAFIGVTADASRSYRKNPEV